MASGRSASYRDSLLGVQKLREMIRAARGGSAPDHVARSLRYSMPELIEEEAEEISRLLAPLIDTARRRLHDAGLEPWQGKSEPAPKLPKREREYIINVAALLGALSMAERVAGRFDNALAHGEEGLAWCRAAGDYRQAVRLWHLVALACHVLKDYAGEEHATRAAVDDARLAQDSEQIIISLDALCSLLVVRYRLDEADAVNQESLILMRKELKGEIRRYYSGLLLNKARILLYRRQEAEGLRTLHEALRWTDAEAYPADRATVLTHLGSTYLRLDHLRQSIECQNEVVQLGAAIGSHILQGWGYFRLAETHLQLGELQQSAYMLDRADECVAGRIFPLQIQVAAKRAQLYMMVERFDEAAALCRTMLASISDRPFADAEVLAHKTLAEIEERQERYQEAREHYERSVEAAHRYFPQRAPPLELRLATVLLQLAEDAEAVALLDRVAQAPALNPQEKMRLMRLRAKVAENQGDFRAALERERESMEIERDILKRAAEHSLRNARIIAETDLLEREMDQERERRRRIERELAEAVVELGERKRMIASVEERLRGVLQRRGTDTEKATISLIRETLAELRTQARAPESPLRYLNGVDDEFYPKLRQRFPNLTPKQERLCALLRAGMGSREIAMLMGLEAEGLKAQRKRLRKRLGLKLEEKLETILAEI